MVQFAELHALIDGGEDRRGIEGIPVLRIRDSIFDDSDSLVILIFLELKNNCQHSLPDAKASGADRHWKTCGSWRGRANAKKCGMGGLDVTTRCGICDSTVTRIRTLTDLPYYSASCLLSSSSPTQGAAQCKGVTLCEWMLIVE